MRYTELTKKELQREYTKLTRRYTDFVREPLELDMTAEDITFFKDIYTKILDKKGSAKILLQTYFGDVRDCYNDICALAFDGIGLDFIEGIKTTELVEKNGFPKDKVLFAGVVNGKNIWKNHYAKTLAIIDDIKDKCGGHILYKARLVKLNPLCAKG